MPVDISPSDIFWGIFWLAIVGGLYLLMRNNFGSDLAARKEPGWGDMG